MKIISVIKLERCVDITNILEIIISKFCYKKKSYPIILFEINKNMKVSFHCIILLFNLAIYLLIKNNKEFLFNIKKII